MRDSHGGITNGSIENGKPESPQYQNVGQNSEMTDSGRSSCYQNLQEFTLETNESYALMPCDQTSEMPDARDHVEDGEEESLYENTEEIESYLQEQSSKNKDQLYHTYEQLDQVFESSEAVDSTDGGMFSRLRQQPTLPPADQLEMEELVIFKNLPTLICRSHLGDESSMTKLADTANAVLREVVKVIHSTVGKPPGI